MDEVTERLDAELGARALERLEVDFLLAPRDAQRLVGPLEVEQADVVLARRHEEVLRVAARLQVRRHVAADRHGAPLDETHLLRQVEVALVLGDGAQVRRRLLVVLLAVLEVGALDRAHRVRGKADAAELGRNLEIADVHLFFLDVEEGVDAVGREHAAEVLDVHRTREALPSQDRVIVEALRHAPVAEDVGKVQLAAGLEHAEDFPEQLLFERGQVDDAVGHDHVDALVGNRAHVLDVALDELDVALLEPERGNLRRLVAPSELELARRHVDADDVPVGADELCGDVHIAPRPAPEVEYRAPFKCRRQRRAAAVEVRDNVGIDVLQDVEHVFGRSRGAIARVGAQRFAVLERIVVVAHHAANLFIGLDRAHWSPFVRKKSSAIVRAS